MQGLQALDQFKSFVSKIGGLGRYEDTYIVHAAEGETVVPMEVLDRNPLLKKRLFKTMVDMGIEPGRYIVGNELNSKNPVTGQPEFFLKKIVSQIRKAMPGDSEKYLGTIAGLATGNPYIGAALGAVGSGVPGAISGGLTGYRSPGISRLGGDTFATNILSQDKVGPMGITDILGSPGKFFLGKGEQSGLFGTGGRLPFQKAKTTPSSIASEIAEIQKSIIDPQTKKPISFDQALEIYKETKGEGGKGKGLGTLGSLGTLAGGLFATGVLGSQIPKPKDALVDRTLIKEPERTDDFAFAPNQTYTRPEIESPFAPATFAAEGGVMDLQDGGESKGPGTGTSDSIPAMLSDGEFVMTAKAVRGAGGGDRREGARKMYEAMDKLEARA